jgi:PAS domain S-box-containing protein
MEGGTGLLITAWEVPPRPPAPPARTEVGCGSLLDVMQDAVRGVAARKGAQEALRESEATLRLLAEAMPQIVCVLTPEGGVEYVNRTWIAFSGLDLQGTQAAGWPGVLHPDDLAAARACRLRLLKQRTPQELELRYRAADGSYRWFLSRLAPVVAGDRVLRFVGAAMDIEARRQAEDTLRDEDRHKDQFLGLLSHELRNPLAPIRNSVWLLRHGPEAQRERSLRIIERQTEHLTRLVDELLDVTRIARGKVQLRTEPLDLRDLVRRAGEDFRSVVEEHGVGFRVELPDRPVEVRADATRVGQVIGNLLANAAKFTRPGDEVRVSLAAVGEAAEIRVADTGAGIEPSLLPRVFEAFVQADRTLARTEGGLGLGLALVKGLVELHGGKVAAQSEGSGRGSVFTVSLPLVTARDRVSLP